MPYDPIKYQEEKERRAVWSKTYRLKNKDKERLRHKLYRQKNKEKRAGYERKRRAIKRNSTSEPYTITDVLEKYGTLCHICNLEIDLNAERRSGKDGWEQGLHIDHLIEISKGGADTLENVRPAHGLCNLERNGKYKTLIVS
jgi:5-methylcytosine-specific restriction endonuclease McrA